MPVNPNHAEINAQAARADPDSVFHHYRRLIELRHAEPVVAHGDFTMLLADDERVYAFTRRLGDVELLVLGNFSGEPAEPDVPGWADAEVLVGEGAGLALAPWEGRVLRRTARSGDVAGPPAGAGGL
jgi:oligo-1,6-glucosidase